jgi:hypothetical protein
VGKADLIYSAGRMETRCGPPHTAEASRQCFSAAKLEQHISILVCLLVLRYTIPRYIAATATYRGIVELRSVDAPVGHATFTPRCGRSSSSYRSYV